MLEAYAEFIPRLEKVGDGAATEVVLDIAPPVFQLEHRHALKSAGNVDGRERGVLGAAVDGKPEWA